LYPLRPATNPQVLAGSHNIDLPRLYFDDPFRDRAIARVTDPIVARFWRKEFAGYDQRFRTEAAAPILNKVGQIAASPVLIVFRVSSSDAAILAPEFHPLPAHELADQSPYSWSRRCFHLATANKR
jgi:hypothetical protein